MLSSSKASKFRKAAAAEMSAAFVATATCGVPHSGWRRASGAGSILSWDIA